MESTTFADSDNEIHREDKIILDPELKIINSNERFFLIFSPLNQKIIKIKKDRYLDLQKNNNFNDTEDHLLYSGLFINKGDTINSKNETNELTIIFQGCNSDCKYCYLDESFKKFDPDFLKKSINQFVSHKKRNLIGFHGGETQYSRKTIKKVVNLINSKVENVEYSIQTSGAMQDSFANWINDHIDSVLLSTDGPKHIQNKFRPLKGGKNSFKLVDRTIDVIDKDKLTTHTVVTNYNVSRLDETIDYFVGKGVNKIGFAPVWVSKKGERNDIEELDFDAYRREAFKILKDNYDNELKIIFSGYDKLVRNKSCMAVNKNALSIFPKNNVGKCLVPHEKFNVNSKQSSQEIQLNKDRMNKLAKRSVQNMPACQDCFLKYNCAGFCPLKNYKYSNSIYNPNPEICNHLRNMNRKLMIFIAKKELNYE